jgi:glycosyltransferase involved in cell wall biosynthesis
MKLAIIFPKDSESLFNKASKVIGGAATVLYLFVKELTRHKEVECYSLIVDYPRIDFDEERYFNFVKMYKNEDNSFKKIAALNRVLQSVRPQFLAQRGLTLWSCLLALYSKIFSIKFVFMVAHDIESLGKYQKNNKTCLLFRLLVRCSAIIIAQNEFQRDNIISRFPDATCNILKKGIDFGKIKKSSVKEYAGIWIARCDRWKNPELFMKLASQNPSKRFCMICTKIPERAEYFYEIQEKVGNSSNIDFFDFVNYESIYDLISKSRCLILTSDMEGDWPMTVLEATASGIPVLSYKLNYGTLINGYNGGYFCNDNFELMNEYLNVLHGNESQFKLMSDGASRYARDNHSIENNVKKFIEILKGL